uniref:Uncharacterized protein n=1 Tax=Anguilla anguilla TaxID=7936 RepID=A0A0E9TP87_ANGAN
MVLPISNLNHFNPDLALRFVKNAMCINAKADICKY